LQHLKTSENGWIGCMNNDPAGLKRSAARFRVSWRRRGGKSNRPLHRSGVRYLQASVCEHTATKAVTVPANDRIDIAVSARVAEGGSRRPTLPQTGGAAFAPRRGDGAVQDIEK
jgi:hypothetical protein